MWEKPLKVGDMDLLSLNNLQPPGKKTSWQQYSNVSLYIPA